MQYRTHHLCIIIMYAVHIGPPMFSCKYIWKDNGKHLTSETTRLSHKKQSLLIMQLTNLPTNEGFLPTQQLPRAAKSSKAANKI